MAYQSIWRPDIWGPFGVLEYATQSESDAPRYSALTDRIAFGGPTFAAGAVRIVAPGLASD